MFLGLKWVMNELITEYITFPSYAFLASLGTP